MTTFKQKPKTPAAKPAQPQYADRGKLVGLGAMACR